MTNIKIGVLREQKSPPDMRVPLTPLICAELTKQYPNLEIYIQPSPIRCYSDTEYTAFGVTLKEDLSDCDILMGVKEVPYDKLIPNKKYFFFSHTIKKSIALFFQAYVLEKTGVKQGSDRSSLFFFGKIFADRHR